MGRALTPANLRKYKQLRARYIRDYTFRVVCDMYRNLHGEQTVAAHFFAEHDLAYYSVTVRGEDRFAPVSAGYSPVELAFLAERRVKPL